MKRALHVMPVQAYPTSVHTGIYQTTRRRAPEHSRTSDQQQRGFIDVQSQKAATVSFNLHLAFNV